jgi:hypothetical protein
MEVNAVSGKPLFLIPALALVPFASGALAGDGKDQVPKPDTAKKSDPAKWMSPVKALQDAVKNLAKAQSYRASCTIEGGLSDREDHEVTERTVGESYAGEVFTQAGTLMHVPSMKAFRNMKKGVAYVDGAWRNILSYPQTTRLDRLFSFPEVILGRALTHAPNGARWLPPKEEEKVDQADSDEDSSDEDEGSDAKPEKPAKAEVGDKPTPSGKTVARPAASEKPAGPQPRIVHVDVPPEVALKSFIEAQNSGCMSAG